MTLTKAFPDLFVPGPTWTVLPFTRIWPFNLLFSGLLPSCRQTSHNEAEPPTRGMHRED